MSEPTGKKEVKGDDERTTRLFEEKLNTSKPFEHPTPPNNQGGEWSKMFSYYPGSYYRR